MARPAPRRCLARFSRPSESSPSTEIRSRRRWACSASIRSTRCSRKLDQAVADWHRADPSTPIQPALHLIAVVAQGAPGRDGMYRLRMDTSLIEKVYGWAKRKNALLFLDIQVGHSTLQNELPRLLPFLSRPDVHLGIDPEFSMHYEREGMRPSSKIGEMMRERRELRRPNVDNSCRRSTCRRRCSSCIGSRRRWYSERRTFGRRRRCRS